MKFPRFSTLAGHPFQEFIKSNCTVCYDSSGWRRDSDERIVMNWNKTHSWNTGHRFFNVQRYNQVRMSVPADVEEQ